MIIIHAVQRVLHASCFVYYPHLDSSLWKAGVILTLWTSELTLTPFFLYKLFHIRFCHNFISQSIINQTRFGFNFFHREVIGNFQTLHVTVGHELRHSSTLFKIFDHFMVQYKYPLSKLDMLLYILQECRI